jgi:photosystem II stability/assembly factor-like uncharacterized protein
VPRPILANTIGPAVARFVRALGAALLAALPAVAAAQDVPPSNALLRQRYFLEQRAYPFDRPPAGALERARRQAELRWPIAFRPAARTAAAFAADPEGWSPLGPANIERRDAGRISAIALHPSDAATIYIGAAQGGVWRTRDAGANWTPLTDGECSLAMGALAIDPVSPDIVYAGTGELHFSGDSYYGCGVLRSTDGGDTWTHLGADIFDTDAGGARISKVIVDAPTAGSAAATTVYAASSSGVYRSPDSGATWAQVLAGTATDLLVDPTNPRVFYAALGLPGGHASNGVYRSADGGDTWTRLATGFPTAEVGRIALAIAPSAPATLFAAIQDAFSGNGNNGALLGIWKTTDAGASWARLTGVNVSCNNQCWYDLVMAVDPLDANVVYFGGVGLYRSTNGGQRFSSILRGIHVDQHALVVDPRDPAVVYAGNDGGIYRTADRGGSWTSLNTNLAITQFYGGVGPHPFEPAAVLGGTQDNGTLEFAGDPTWSSVLGADGGFTAYDHQDPAVAYAEMQWTPNSGFSGPRRRDAPGAFGPRRVNGIVIADRALFIPPLVMDPADAHVLYFGTFRLYRTADRADSWSAISGDLSRAGGSISAIAPAASDPGTVWVGTNDGNVQVTTDGGATWTARAGDLPQRVVTDIAVDRDDPRTAIVTFSGFGLPHVYRTTDGGATWTSISAGLPDVPVNAVLTHPALGDDIYIGTDLGAFRSIDGGATWAPFNLGMPNVAIFDLAYSNETGRITAATHGRGMFAHAPAIASAVAFADDSLFIDGLDAVVHTAVTAVDASGLPIPDPALTWRSLDRTVVTVDLAGSITSRGIGTTHVVAALGGRSDTLRVRVAVVIAAVQGLPDSASMVVREKRTFPAAAADSRGVTVPGAQLAWSSSDPTVADIDQAGVVTALRLGDATISAALEGFRDTLAVRVRPPSVLALSVQPGGSRERQSSRSGARVSLLRLHARVDGPEEVRVDRLGFQLQGTDGGAELQLVSDTDRNGTAEPDEPVVAAAASPLTGGIPRDVTLTIASLVIAGGDSAAFVLALRTSGAAPNGTTFTARFLPEATRTANLRSGEANRVQQPASAESGAVATTVLAPAAALSLSENPVRGDRVFFNFRVAPTRVGVYTVTGRLVADLTAAAGLTAEWDLRNEEGTLVAPGVYLIVFEVDGQLYRERLIVLRGRSDAEAVPSRAEPRSR